MLETLSKLIGGYRGEIVAFTQQLIKIATMNPPGRNYQACIKLLTGKLSEMGFFHRTVAVPQSRLQSMGVTSRRVSVLAEWGKGEPVLHFHGHYDVVPAFSETQFQPFVQDERIYGRGSADMKGGIAAMLYGLKALKESGFHPHGKVVLSLVPDEETGGMGGTHYLFETEVLKTGGVGMLMPEPTGGCIWNANRGAITLEVTVRGKTAHVGLVREGVNAFEGMIRVAQALLEHKKRVEKHRTAYATQHHDSGGSILLVGGVCEGGTAFNVVPEKCSFTVDRRFNPEEDLDEVKGALWKVFHRFQKEGVEIDVKTIQMGSSSGVGEDTPVAKALAASVQEVVGNVPPFCMCPGLLEIRYFNEKTIPAYGYGPGLLEVSHGPEEWVGIDALLDCSLVYALTAAGVLGRGGG